MKRPRLQSQPATNPTLRLGRVSRPAPTGAAESSPNRAGAAIEAAAVEFKIDAWKLIAVRSFAIA
jgi:hypothetical protein